MSEIWRTTREWEGQTCVVLGSGPSMRAADADAARDAGVRAIAVNNTGVDFVSGAGVRHCAMAPWADVLYAADSVWWLSNREEAAKFRGRKASMMPHSFSNMTTVLDDTLLFRNGGAEGFDDRPDHLRTGWNSGYQAVHLAAHLGCAKVVLLGFDMHTDRGHHWFGDHSNRRDHRSRYESFVGAFETLAPELERRGVDVVNCTQGSALGCFRVGDLGEELYAVRQVRENEGHDAEARPGGARGDGAARGGGPAEAQAGGAA